MMCVQDDDEENLDQLQGMMFNLPMYLPIFTLFCDAVDEA